MHSPQILSGLQRRQTLSIVGLSLLITALIITSLAVTLQRGKEIIEQEIRERLRSMAAVAASQIDGVDVDQIRTRSDIFGDSYLHVLRQIADIKENAADIHSVYIMRRTDDANTFAFVVDADHILPIALQDENKNGVIDRNEVVPLPGDLYDVSGIPSLRNEAFLHPAVDAEFTTDQWGTTLSGYAPIERSDNGKIVAVLGIDMNAWRFMELSQDTFFYFLLLLLIIGCCSIAGGFGLLLLQRRMDVLRRLERERAGLLLLTSHQLGQPLTIFKLSLEMLQEQIQSPELKKAVEEHIDHMNEGIFRMNNLLVLLKEAARVEERNMDYRPVWVRLPEFVESIRVQCASPLQRKLQRLEIAVPDDVQMFVDRKLLESAFLQLLDNAMSFSPEGSTITMRAMRHGSQVRITIRDEGCGIPAKDLPRISEKFVRAGNAAHMKPDGSGLGLYIAKGIIRRAGGSLGIESTEDAGTTVTVSLPVEE